jgi:glycosyltransferase involved in cell wall biosynthesis
VQCEISIIMPAYKAAGTIEETLRSALAQTFRDFEVLVVDDGSPDATADIVRAVAASDPRVKLIQQQNAGVSAARNHALRVARGRWIAMLDADDLWVPEKLQAQIGALGGRQDAAVVGAVRRFHDDVAGRHWLHETFPPPAAASPALYLRSLLEVSPNSMVLFNTSLVPADVLRSVGGWDESLSTAEDWDLWLRTAARIPYIVLPMVLQLYRKSAGSATRHQDPVWVAGKHHAILEKQRSLSNAPSRAVARAMAGRKLGLAATLLNLHRHRDALVSWAGSALHGSNWTRPEFYKTGARVCARLIAPSRL